MLWLQLCTKERLALTPALAEQGSASLPSAPPSASIVPDGLIVRRSGDTDTPHSASQLDHSRRTHTGGVAVALNGSVASLRAR